MKARSENLMPGGVPRWVRCYDNGGETADRFTVVFTGRYRKIRDDEFLHLGMSANPYHPQGVGLHGSHPQQIDVNESGFAPAIGRKCHLGKRIPFSELPPDCQSLVKADYRELWNLA